jgi:hypothetical protein
MQKENAILIFSRPPYIHRSRGDEPFASLPWDDLDALFSAFVGDLLETASKVPGADAFFFKHPKESMDEFLYPLREKIRFRGLQGDSPAEHIRHAVEHVFAEGYQRVVVLLDNQPHLTVKYFKKMFDQLKYEDECIVASPTVDGKCLLVGMKSDYSAVFDPADIDPLKKPMELLRRLCAVNGVLFLTHQSYLLDTGYNIARLKKTLEAPGIPDEDSPFRTAEIFKKFTKKYKMKYSMP